MTQTETVNKIISWLKKQCIDMGMKGFLIDATEHTTSAALAYLLCEKTGRKTCSLVKEYDTSWLLTHESNQIHKDKDKFEIAAEMARYATKHKLLVVGFYNKYDLEIIRPWPRFCMTLDILPFGNMTKEEVDRMYAVFTDLKKPYDDIYINRATNDSSPFSDGVKPTFAEIDWAYNLSKRQIKYKDIITFDGDPVKHPFWFGLTSRQKSIISFLHEHIRITNTNLIIKPIFF